MKSFGAAMGIKRKRIKCEYRVFLVKGYSCGGKLSMNNEEWTKIGTSYFFMAFLVHAHRMCALISVFPSVLGSLAGSYRARVQRGESATARCASTEDHQAPSLPLSAALAERVLSLTGGVARVPLTARIGRALFYRARSASKKDTWPLLPLSHC